jgi:hypothetical protein
LVYIVYSPALGYCGPETPYVSGGVLDAFALAPLYENKNKFESLHTCLAHQFRQAQVLNFVAHDNKNYIALYIAQLPHQVPHELPCTLLRPAVAGRKHPVSVEASSMPLYKVALEA